MRRLIISILIGIVIKSRNSHFLSQASHTDRISILSTVIFDAFNYLLITHEGNSYRRKIYVITSQKIQQIRESQIIET